jgi:hypothetical protein
MQLVIGQSVSLSGAVFDTPSGEVIPNIKAAFSSSAPSVAEIKTQANGEVILIAKAVGSATITAAYSPATSATLPITVVAALTPGTIQINVGYKRYSDLA